MIIDGYNVIYALDRYRGLQKEDREAAVEKLLLDLVNLAGAADADITVVFDGIGAGSETKIGRVNVIYSSGKKSADAVIERLVFSARDLKEIAVCTGDYAQQKVIGRRGVRRMVPRELEDMMAAEVEEARRERRAGARVRLENRLPASVRRRLEEMRRP